MAQLQSQALNNMTLSARMSDSDQTSRFVEESVEEMARRLSGDIPDASKFGIGYDSETRKISLQYDGTEIGSVDASDFVKDGMISDVAFDDRTYVLTITWNSDGGGKTTEVNLSGLIDAYTAGEGLKLENGEFSLTASIPAKTSDLSNDSGFLTAHQDLTEYVTKSDAETLSSSITGWVEGQEYLTEHQSLSDYYLKSETSSASEIETALEGKQPSGDYLTEETDPVFQGLSGQFLTEHQSLDGYYQKSETSSATEVETALAGKQPVGDYATSAYVGDQIRLSVHYYNSGDGIVVEPYFNELETLGPAAQTVHRVKIDEDYTATKSYVRNTVDDVVISALSDVAQYESYEQVPLSAVIKSLWLLSRRSAWPAEEA